MRHQVIATDTPPGASSGGAAEPKKLRYRLLHIAARITHSGRRTRLRIAETWPWATELATAFTRLATLPRPVTGTRHHDPTNTDGAPRPLGRATAIPNRRRSPEKINKQPAQPRSPGSSKTGG